jgi:hypothetical protein
MNGFDVLKRVLEKSVSDDGPVSGAPRHASVCVLVAGANQIPSICFIRRSKWDGDPWSEHIAFPGGSRKGDETAAQPSRLAYASLPGVDSVAQFRLPGHRRDNACVAVFQAIVSRSVRERVGTD